MGGDDCRDARKLLQIKRCDDAAYITYFNATGLIKVLRSMREISPPAEAGRIHARPENALMPIGRRLSLSDVYFAQPPAGRRAAAAASSLCAAEISRPDAMMRQTSHAEPALYFAYSMLLRLAGRQSR